jgi:hypothetical protein
MANFLSNLTNVFVTTETWVFGVVTKIKSGVQIAENDVAYGLRWIANNTPAITAYVQEIEAAIAVIVAANPAFGTSTAYKTALTAANGLVAGLQAIQADETTNKSNAATLADAYAAFKSAQAAANNAAAAVAGATS